MFAVRSLDECKAEVFRRSERRIKERKRIRNRALALCIPLCLLILLSASMLPGALFAGSGDAPEGSESSWDGGFDSEDFWEGIVEGSEGIPDEADGSATCETESDSGEGADLVLTRSA